MARINLKKTLENSRRSSGQTVAPQQQTEAQPTKTATRPKINIQATLRQSGIPAASDPAAQKPAARTETPARAAAERQMRIYDGSHGRVGLDALGVPGQLQSTLEGDRGRVSMDFRGVPRAAQYALEGSRGAPIASAPSRGGSGHMAGGFGQAEAQRAADYTALEDEIARRRSDLAGLRPDDIEDTAQYSQYRALQSEIEDLENRRRSMERETPALKGESAIDRFDRTVQGAVDAVFGFDPFRPLDDRDREMQARMETGGKAENGKNASLGELIGGSIVTGMADFNKQVASGLDFLLPTDFLGEYDPFSALNDLTTENQAALRARQEYALEDRSRAAKIASEIGSGTVAALPQAITALLTLPAAGISSTASLAQQTAARNIFGAAPGRAGRLAEGLATGIQAIARNPGYWQSFITTVGGEYEDARAQGGTEWESALSAIVAAMANSVVEVGGGIQTLPEELQKPGTSALLEWFKSGLDEGKEEVIQSLISGITQKALVDGGKPVFSLTDEDAVVNPLSLLEDFGMGAAVGWTLGGGESLLTGALNRQARRENAAQAELYARPALETQEVRIPQETAPETHGQEAALLRKYADAFGESGKRAMQAAYAPEQNAAEFYAGFAAQYQAGLTGRDSAKARAGNLTQAQQYAAYTAGQNDARASLEAERRAQRTRAASPGLVRNEQAAALPKDQSNFLNRLAREVGVRIELTESIADEAGNPGAANGVYLPESNTVRIAMDAEQPIVTVAAHEITHYLQQTAPEDYRAYRDYANRALSEQLGTAAVDEAMRRYAAHGQTLTMEQAMDEVAAEFAEAMTKDGKLFESLVRENRSVAQKVLDAVKAFLEKVRRVFAGSRAAQDSEARRVYGVDMDTLEQAARLWQQAYDAAGKAQGSENAAREGGEGRYSIKYDRDNTPYVEVENDILEGVPEDQWVKTVKENLRQKFPNGITVGNNVISINGQSQKEMTYSKYTRYLMQNDPSLYADKLRATNNADEILKTSQDWVNEALMHPRKDTIQEFARGSTQLRIGASDYIAQVIVAKRSDGKLLLYDILALSPTEIQAKEQKSDAVISKNPSPGTGRSTALGFDTSIAQEDGEVNGKFSLKEKSGPMAEDLRALQRENERLRERVEHFKGQLRQTHRATTDRASVARAARELVRSYGADVDTKALTGRLQSLYDYIAGGGDGKNELTYEEARRRAEEIGREIVENAVERNSEVYETYADLRKFLRGAKLSISEADLEGFPDFNDFRKRNFGRLSVSSGETNIDQAYSELSQLWPEFFDEQAVPHPQDQLRHIAEVLDGVYRITEENPFTGDMEQAAAAVAGDILEAFFDLPQTKPTFADKQARMRGDQRAELRRRADAAIARERARREKQVSALKSRYAARDAAGRERRSARELRRRIARHAGALSQKLLRPTDKQHIPENLRTAVAAMLESINLESAYSVSEDGTRRKGADGAPTKRTEAFQRLKEQYAAIAREGGVLVIDPSLLGDDKEGIQGGFDQVISMGDIRLADMNTTQLQTVWNVVRAVEHAVTTAGKTLSKSKYRGTAEWADALQRDTADRRGRRGNAWNKGRMDLETPYTFFSHFGDAGKAVYRLLRDAQDAQQIMVDTAADAVKKVVSPKTVRALERETNTFRTDGGAELTLSKAQIMDLYLLSKREQGRGHLLAGGVVQPAVKGQKIERGTESIRLTESDLRKITGSLSAEEKKIADGLQAITAGLLADYGNDASMRAYGYRKFTEKNYWPIRSARESLHSNVEKGEGNTRSIKNIGMAKNTVPNAGNPVDLGSIFDTFSRHASDMTDYAAWLAPMEDANRLFNFQFRDGDGNLTGKTVKGILDRVAGRGIAQQYWSRLMEDIQNGIQAPGDSALTNLAAKGIGAFKGAAVGGNVRVVIQQPTAFFRALAVLGPQDLGRGLAAGVTRGNGWEKALRYAPIARRKDAGGFDISSPTQMRDTLFDQRSGLRKFNDSLSWAAGKADAVTWGKLWNACEWATAREHPGLEQGGEAFYRETAKRFAEVIDQTQVVDGVLQRSNIMRSSNAVAQQATSFMGEPIMSLNLLMRSWDAVRSEQDTKKRGKAIRTLGRAGLALVLTNVINALAQSLIDAGRDDDPDKKYWERYREAFSGLTGEEESGWEKALAFALKGNVGSNMNLIGQIPFAKDVMSIAQGYSVNRTEMEVMEDLVQAGQLAVDAARGGSKTPAYAAKKALDAGAKLFGIPASNLSRDIWSLARSIAVETDNIPYQYEMEKAIYSISNVRNLGRYSDILYRALERDDMDSYWHIRKDLMENMGIDGEKIDSALKSRFQKALKEDPGKVPGEKTQALLGILPAAEGEEEKKGFSAKDLGADAYRTYTERRSADYREMAETMSGYDSFRTLDEDSQQKLMNAAYSLAKNTALQESSGGKYQVDTKWMQWASGGEAAGVDEAEAILFKLAYEMNKGDHKKEDTIEQAKAWMPWLTEEEMDYLKSNYWKPDKE